MGLRPLTLAQDKQACGGEGPPPARKGKNFAASPREARRGFTERRRGDEILERRPHVHFSLHPCQLSSVVLCSIPEKGNLTGWARPRGGPFLGQCPALDESVVARRAAQSRVVPCRVGLSGLRWLSELSPALPTPLYTSCIVKGPGREDVGGTEIQPCLGLGQRRTRDACFWWVLPQGSTSYNFSG